MGVSVEGGGGRGKSMNFDLNLVPFIDFLSVCITFLIATAVWTQIMSMQVDQAISTPNPNDPPPPPSDEKPVPPLTVHIRADGVWVGREQAGQCIDTDVPDHYWGCNYPMIDGQAYDWEKITADLVKDRAKYPEEQFPETDQLILFTDDGVHYEHMVKALDLTRELAFDKTLLAGGPAQTSTQLPGGK